MTETFRALYNVIAPWNIERCLMNRPLRRLNATALTPPVCPSSFCTSLFKRNMLSDVAVPSVVAKHMPLRLDHNIPPPAPLKFPQDALFIRFLLAESHTAQRKSSDTAPSSDQPRGSSNIAQPLIVDQDIREMVYYTCTSIH